MFDGVIKPSEPYGVSLEEKLLPEYLKELGYSTHIIGKVRPHIDFLKQSKLASHHDKIKK